VQKASPHRKASTLRGPMYLSHFNLREKPFKVSTDPKFLWLGEKQKEAIEAIRYGILYGDGYVVLTGDVGTGKTTLATALVNTLSDQLVAARIPYPDVEILDFLRLISTVYGIDSDFPSKAAFRDRFESFLRGCLSTGRKAVLVVDEAQKLCSEHLGELMQLSSVEEKGVGLFNIVFVGQNEFNDILLLECNRASRQRTAINYHLAPLTRTETEQYIAHRLKVANGQKEIFAPEAIHEVFLQSGGIPRLINIICDLALLMTYLEGGRCVRAEAVKQGMERLRLPGEKPAFIAAGTEYSPAPQDKIGAELTAGKSDQVFPEAVREDPLRWARGKFLWARGKFLLARDRFLLARGRFLWTRDKFLWAGGITLGVVLLGLAFLFLRGGQDRTSEAPVEKVSQEGSTSQVEVKPSKELNVGGAPTSPSSEPTLPGADKVSDSSDQRRASSGLAETKPSNKTSTQGTRAKGTGRESGKAESSASFAVPTRKILSELLREEKVSPETKKSLDERREPPLKDTRETRSQSPGSTAGSSVQETPGKETEEVEPGMVIDWLLEKRNKK
jgi:type II secretory pathway predicted ATPase ExeA